MRTIFITSRVLCQDHQTVAIVFVNLVSAQCGSRFPGKVEELEMLSVSKIGRALESVLLHMRRECIITWQFENFHI